MATRGRMVLPGVTGLLLRAKKSILHFCCVPQQELPPLMCGGRPNDRDRKFLFAPFCLGGFLQDYYKKRLRKSRAGSRVINTGALHRVRSCLITLFWNF